MDGPSYANLVEASFVQGRITLATSYAVGAIPVFLCTHAFVQSITFCGAGNVPTQHALLASALLAKPCTRAAIRCAHHAIDPRDVSRYADVVDHLSIEAGL